MLRAADMLADLVRVARDGGTADLERAEAAGFYRRVGALGRVFMQIEVEAFALPG